MAQLAESRKMLSLNDLKKDGCTINLFTTKNGFNGVKITDGDVEFVALSTKTFEGDITLKTYVFAGENEKGEPRNYLTNNYGGGTLGAEL